MNRSAVLWAAVLIALALGGGADAAGTITAVTPSQSSLTLTQGQSQSFEAELGGLVCTPPDPCEAWEEAEWTVDGSVQTTQGLSGQETTTSFNYTFDSTGTYAVAVQAKWNDGTTSFWTSAVSWTVTVEPPQYTVTISASEGGTVSPSGTSTYEGGSSVAVTATPASCYQFVEWTCSGVTVADPNGASTTMTVNGDGTLTATFEKIRYTISVQDPNGGTCSLAPGDYLWDCGYSTSISASPDTGYEFVQWDYSGLSLVDPNSSSTTLTVNGDGHLFPQFALKKVIVPNVLEMSESEARSAISAVGLSPMTVWTYNDDVPRGQLVGQDPVGGTVVDWGSTVEVRLSQGPLAPRTVSVPRVTGMTEAEAQAVLASAGLTVGTTAQSHSPTVPAGQVLSQNPAAGSQVPIGSAVNLTFSLGPVPDDDDDDDGSAGNDDSAARGDLYTVGKAGIHRISLDGTVEHLLALHKDSYDIEIRDDRLYVTETTRGGSLVAYSLDGSYLMSIPIPAAARDYYRFVTLPDRRFALLDNLNDEAFFIDETGSLLAATKLLAAPDGLYQNLSGIVVGNRLILSENGSGQVLAVDLTTYRASIFKDLSHLPQPLGDIAYAGGTYYILAGSRMVYRFTESGGAAMVGQTGGVYVTGICILGNFAYISTNSANKIFELDLRTGVAGELASGIHYPRDIEYGEAAGAGAGDAGACCGFGPGDRVVLMVDTPRDSQGTAAVGLYAGTLGTVVCCDHDDPDLPLYVSWDGWANGKNSDTYCDPPVMSYAPNSGWWVSCELIEPWNDGDTSGCEADLTPYLNAVWTFTPRTLDLCTSGQAISITYGVQNQGCDASGSYSVDFYASTDSTITGSDYLLGKIAKNSFAAGERGTWRIGGFQLDPGQLPSGTYYVAFIVDGRNEVQESLETNNVGLMPGTLTVASCGDSGSTK